MLLPFPRLSLTLLLAVAGPAFAATIASTFGPSGSFDGGVVYEISDGQHIAASFTPSSSAHLTSIRVAVLHFSGENDFQVFLAADDAGQPGTVLELYSALVFPLAPGILTLPSVTNPLLLSGVTYWVAMLPGGLATRGGWHWNDQGFLGVSAFIDSSGWSSFPAETTPAFDVNADPIPEPAAAGLLFTGLLLLGLRRRPAHPSRRYSIFRTPPTVE